MQDVCGTQHLVLADPADVVELRIQTRVIGLVSIADVHRAISHHQTGPSTHIVQVVGLAVEPGGLAEEAVSQRGMDRVVVRGVRYSGFIESQRGMTGDPGVARQRLALAQVPQVRCGMHQAVFGGGAIERVPGASKLSCDHWSYPLIHPTPVLSAVWGLKKDGIRSL
jgi:hypothetical protein